MTDTDILISHEIRLLQLEGQIAHVLKTLDNEKEPAAERQRKREEKKDYDVKER